jgi:hypothetical protein
VSDAKKKRAKSALRAIHALKRALRQDEMKEALGQILGVVPIISSLPDEGVNRIPIAGAEFLQSCLRAVGIPLRGIKDNAPLCGGKFPALVLPVLTFFSHGFFERRSSRGGLTKSSLQFSSPEADVARYLLFKLRGCPLETFVAGGVCKPRFTSL